MCGIAGILNINQEKVNFSDLKKMTDIIYHRGPDGEGHWINESGRVGFGHRRLSILDLSDLGKQPMHYADGRYTITFNGEIYNYIELKKDLELKGYKFKSLSDTEVLLALYDLKKEKCLQDLDGMFSFVIWDEKEQLLFCARDRFGEKPFHYYYDGGKFVFASEIKQFWTLDIQKKIDNNKFENYIHKGIIENKDAITETFYENIKKLDAAHYLIIQAGKTPIIHKYWEINLNAKPFIGTIEQAAEKFLELFTNSIRLRLRSDVPVGSSLSGGLDSSSIVMLIDQLKENSLKQNTFSARFKNFIKDEGEYIETVVKACKNVNVHYTWPDKDYFEAVFDKVAYHQDEPFGSASIIAQYAVMELSKQNNVTVLLDGQGADEYLAGYLRYYRMYLDQLFYQNTARYNSEFSAYNTYHHAVGKYTSILSQETLRMRVGRYKRLILKKEMPFKNNLKINLHESASVFGLKELLRYADRNSMAHSREVRLPFLSHQLVEFVFSLPDEYIINQGWTKFILRKAMNPILPQSICWRVDKIGYESPQNKWVTSEKFKPVIIETAKKFNIELSNVDNSNTSLTKEWRLLMASKYL